MHIQLAFLLSDRIRMMKRHAILISIIILVAVASIGIYFRQKLGTQNSRPLVQKVVEPDITANWKRALIVNNVGTFRYPNLSTTYIRPQQWPPEVSISSGVFSCKQEGLGVNGHNGMTIQKIIGSRMYCNENVSGGAAGSTYTTYTYTVQKDSKLVKFVFILAYPQCDNYSEPDRTKCINERQTFDLDILISQIAQTVQCINTICN